MYLSITGSIFASASSNDVTGAAVAVAGTTAAARVAAARACSEACPPPSTLGYFYVKTKCNKYQ